LSTTNVIYPVDIFFVDIRAKKMYNNLVSNVANDSFAV